MRKRQPKIENASSKSTAPPKSVRRKRRHDELADDELLPSEDVSNKASRRLQGRSRSLELPAELRDMIYEFVLIPYTSASEDESQIWLERYTYKPPPDLVKDILYRSRPIMLPALTLVSSQVRQESLAVFFGRNTFRFFSWRNPNKMQHICDGQKFSHKGYHMLGAASEKMLAHPSWSDHADLVRRLTLEMQISVELGRLVDGKEVKPVRILYYSMDVTFTRNIKATPQYSVSVRPAPEDPNRKPEFWLERLRDRYADKASEEEAVAEYFGLLAQIMLHVTRDEFAFSIPGLLAFMQLMPLRLVWHGSELTHNNGWTQLRHFTRLHAHDHVRRDLSHWGPYPSSPLPGTT